LIPKFRVWDKHDKRMSYGTPELYDDMIGIRFEHFSVETDSFDDLIIMQSTGLKDKNGVEIYEGDVVKFIGTYKESKGKELGRYKVEWNDYYTGFYPLIDDYLRGNSEWEVIGKIYENPELLESESNAEN